MYIKILEDEFQDERVKKEFLSYLADRLERDGHAIDLSEIESVEFRVTRAGTEILDIKYGAYLTINRGGEDVKDRFVAKIEFNDYHCTLSNFHALKKPLTKVFRNYMSKNSKFGEQYKLDCLANIREANNERLKRELDEAEETFNIE